MVILTKDQLKAEAMYQATMHIAKKMVDEGIVTESEYQEVEDLFIEKYKPVYGKLFSSLELQDPVIADKSDEI